VIVVRDRARERMEETPRDPAKMGDSPAMKVIVLLAALLALVAAPVAAASDDPPPKLKSTLTYTRSGGIDGASHTLTIKRDGHAKLDAHKFRLRASERDAVAALVAKAGDFGSIKVDAKPAVPDAYVHTLEYAKHTLTFDDPSTPKKLRKLRDVLGRLIAKYDET
jgi:hypothetical protein